MKFPIAASLLDALVLGVLSDAPAYGYELTQRLRSTVELSESTLYPVLRRLSGEHLLDSYDATFDGRNRRYYRLTGSGAESLRLGRDEWQRYKTNIESLLYCQTQPKLTSGEVENHE